MRILNRIREWIAAHRCYRCGIRTTFLTLGEIDECDKCYWERMQNDPYHCIRDDF